MNYPIRLLSRQCNPFTTEILAYINGAPQKIIVLSDLDEHMACTAGNSFYEKGVDNVFIVSGGMPWPCLNALWWFIYFTKHVRLPQESACTVLNSLSIPGLVLAVSTPTAACVDAINITLSFSKQVTACFQHTERFCIGAWRTASGAVTLHHAMQCQHIFYTIMSQQRTPAGQAWHCIM